MQCRLPDLGWARDGSLDGAYTSLVFEHLADLPLMFREAYRVVKLGGVLVTVMNHPFYAAPDSGPVIDPTDGELFWRWGKYLSNGKTAEPAGNGSVTFYHRSLSVLLNMATDSGWVLECMTERGIAFGSDSLLAQQQEIPRLLAVRWKEGYGLSPAAPRNQG